MGMVLDDKDWDNVPEGEEVIVLNKRKAQAIARVLNDQWISRDDMEAMEVVDEICKFANPPTPIKPLEKDEDDTKIPN